MLPFVCLKIYCAKATHSKHRSLIHLSKITMYCFEHNLLFKPTQSNATCFSSRPA